MNKSELFNKNVSNILLIFIILAALFLRLYKIETPLADWHSWRQTDTASVSRIFALDGINMLFPRYQDISNIQTGFDNPNGYRFVEFPIFNALHVFFYKLFGFDFVIAGRLVSIVASLISIFLVYLIGKRFISTAGGLLAAMFFAFIPYSVFYSRTILPEPLSVMFALMAFYYFYKYVDYEKTKWILISAIMLSISILIKPFTLFYLVPMIYLLIKNKNFEKIKKLIFDRRLWIFAIIVLAPFVSWRYWMSAYPEGIPHMKWAFNSDNIRFKPSFFRWIFAERLGTLILGVWGVVPFVFGMIDYEKEKKVIHWFLIGVMLFTFIIATANVRHDYYQIIMIPAISLILSIGSIELWKYSQGFKRQISRLVLLFCLLMMFAMGWFEIRGFYQINNFSIVKAGEAVNRITPSDSFVVAPYNKDTAFLYHTQRSGWPFLEKDINSLIEKGADYYVSVNFDQVTLDIINEYEVVEMTSEYVIVKLQ